MSVYMAEGCTGLMIIICDEDDRASNFVLNVSITYVTMQRQIPEEACVLNQHCENLDLIMNVVC
jgi:hypothetical protein